jgi:hypothetical protein
METGYKVFRSQVIKGMPLKSNRFGFEPEFTVKIAKGGWRIYEVPSVTAAGIIPKVRKSLGAMVWRRRARSFGIGCSTRTP